MDINVKDILKPTHTIIMLGTVAVIILAVLYVLGFGVPVTIASLLIFRHMFFGTGALLKFRRDLQEHKTQYDYKSDELSGDEADRENTIVDFGRKNYEFGEYKNAVSQYEMTARLFVSAKRSLFIISEIIVWLCAGVVLIIGAYQTPPPTLRELVLAFAGTLGTLWSIRLCFKPVETPDDLKGIEDEPEKAVFRNRIRRYGSVDKVIGEGRIVLQGVHYSYPGTKSPAVNGISLEIEPGERFGIIGQTGSGKTTLLRLIGREADTSEGTVFIDGADIKDYTAAALDKIFSEKVSLCEGTPPNERATTPTIIIATQSTKPVMFCDRIAVVTGGTLAAVGTHDDLLRNNEIYRELYTADHPFEPLPPLSDESFTKVLHEAEKE